MATGYLSVLLQSLGGAAHGFFVFLQPSGGALIGCARNRNRKSFMHMVTGFASSETYSYYLRCIEATYIYTWAVGTSPCGDDILPHNDPHQHLASASEWTNIGVAFPLGLPVRAINNIEFGPPALTMCHAQSIAVDTTPPIIYAVDHVTYGEDTFLISYRVNGT
ncbi:hypothetical protein LSAT2_009369 [Lamellibrachia satsuma]|nr:hypothetical protein LSAT2_009369 [Lamellibrachia satsuma]